MRIRITLLTALLAVMLQGACSPNTNLTAVMTPTHGPDAMMERTSDDKSMEKTPDDGTMEATAEGTMMESTAAGADAMMEAPAWFKVEMTNAATGEMFTVADLSGKVVLVETMAQWCSNCKQQQNQVKSLHEMLGMRDDLVTLGLDIDPNEDQATLKTYIERNGFDWHYAVAPVEVSNDLARLYGDQYLNPPSTPMLIIDRHGEVHTLPFGIKSAEDLQKALEPFLSAGM